MAGRNYLNLEDGELWRLLREGDREALNEIYYRNVDILFSYGAKITSDHALVEDNIQEVFITIWEKRKKVKSTTSIKFYLFKSLKRRIYRSLKSTNKIEFQYDFYESDLAKSLASDPATHSLDSATIKKIHHCLNNLTSRQKEILYLSFYAQLNYAEIAEVMGLSKKATYKLMARAIKGLQEKFATSIIFFEIFFNSMG